MRVVHRRFCGQRSMSSRILACLRRAAPAALHLETLRRRLQLDSRQQVGQICQRLAAKGVLVWRGEGLYALREPPPGAGRSR